MKKIEIDDMLRYRFLSNLTCSDDGKSIVFNVSKMDKKDNSYKSYLYMLKDGKIRQLTAMGKESSFLFKNDSELFLFTSRDEEEKKKAEQRKQFTPVYRLPLDGGEAVKAFEIPLRVMDARKIDDERLLIVSAFDKEHPDYYKLSDKQKELIDKQYAADSDYEIIDEAPFYFNGMGFMSGLRRGLFIYDMKKKTLKKITPDKYSVGEYEIMNGKVYYCGQEYEHRQHMRSDIRSYDLKKDKTALLYPEKYTVYGLINFDSRLIVVASKNDRFGLNQDPILFVLDEKNKDLKVFNDRNVTYGNSSGSDCRYGHGRSFKAAGDRLYYVQTRNYKSVLAYYDTEGSSHDVYVADGSIDDFEVSGNDLILNILDTARPQELYQLKNGKIRKLSRFNDDALKGRYVARPEHLTVKSEGYEIDGWVLYPKDYDPKKKYPAVLDIHGGPKTVYGEIFYHEMQVWASRGYFVFFCNPFGSDGKGNEFSDIRGKYGTTDFRNIMDFTDEVIRKHRNIDTKRICVTGGSYGGFMTNWIVGHTDRFVCAATQRSISNWISFLGTSDIGLDFTTDQCAADLNDLNKLWKHSPLKYVNDVKTPILFIHSDEDYRCPLEQGMQYYTAITDRGVETRMVIFHGENHELSRSGKPLHRIKRLTEITDWFEKHTSKQNKQVK